MGFGFLVSGSGFLVSGFGFRVAGVGFMIEDASSRGIADTCLSRGWVFTNFTLNADKFLDPPDWVIDIKPTAKSRGIADTCFTLQS